MTEDQARELFSAALDGDLSAEQRSLFDRCLAGDPGLAAEFEAFGQMVSRAGQLQDQVQVPDLVVGVQAKLRRRRRRESVYLRARGMFSPLTLGLIVAALAALLWLTFTVLTHMPEASDPPASPTDTTDTGGDGPAAR